MVNGNIEISYPYLLDVIRYNRFAAVIGVTNGVVRPEKKADLRRQVLLGKKMLETAVGDSARVLGGAALIKNPGEPITNLDLVMKIAGYDGIVLYDAASEVLQEDVLKGDARNSLLNLLKRAEKWGTRDMVRSLNPPLGRSFPWNRQRRFTDMKGAVLPRYVDGLFARAIGSDYVSCLDVRLRDAERDTEGSSSKEVVINLILTSPRGSFRRGLSEIVQSYDGPRTVEISLPYGEKIIS